MFFIENKKPLYNYEINDWMKKNNINNFIGCYSADNLPPIKKYPSYLIFNYSPHWKDGTHWIAILFISPEICYYYDSLGFPPEYLEDFFGYDTNFYKYMKKYSKYIIYNNKINQDILSSLCGYYDCVFIYCVDKLNFDIKKFNKYMSKNLENNDKTIYKIYKLLD